MPAGRRSGTACNPGDAVGVPRPGQHELAFRPSPSRWVTRSARPAVNSVTQADSDAVALAVLELADHESRETGVAIGA